MMNAISLQYSLTSMPLIISRWSLYRYIVLSGQRAGTLIISCLIGSALS